MSKKIAVIGSTGSIGTQALEVISSLGMQVVSLTAHKNKALLDEQISKYKPRIACLTGGDVLPDSSFAEKVYCGEGSILHAVTEDADVVLVAVSGFSGFEVTLKAVEMGKTVALANKEALVAGGELIIASARKTGARIIPIDSEHSAIWQALNFDNVRFRRLILTASGGPFRNTPKDELKNVSPIDALKHPNWSMGSKITIDCATMLNKGFEVIEAHWLFGAALEQIDVVVHPQSVIHSMVEFADGAVMAQMASPNMKQPIQMALTYPERLPCDIPRLDLMQVARLEFYPLDRDKFPCFDLAIESLKMGDNYPCAMVSASEVAVNAFLKGEILFTEIYEAIKHAVSAVPRMAVSLESLKKTDALSREYAQQFINKEA